MLAAPAVAPRPKRPNVLLLAAEEWSDQSPLPKDCIRFTRAYVACPDRASLYPSILAGRFPHSMRRPGVCEDPTLVSELKRARYVTGCAGPWGCDCPAVAVERANQFLRANIPNDFCLCARMEQSPPDSAVSLLLRTLDATGLAEDTIVVLTSGAGDDTEIVPSEDSVHAPLLIRYPRRIRPGGEHNFLVSHVDLAPTLLGLCGVEPPRSFHGSDLSGLLLTGKGDPPESIYAEGRLRREDEWRMVVRGLDKLVVNAQMEVTHLYNLGQDASETANLASHPAERLKRDEMLALLRRWVLRTGDRLKRR